MMKGTLLKYGKGFCHMLTLLAFLFCSILPVRSAFAQDVECAEVKIVIEQKLSFERQAFDARMLIKNGLDANLKNIRVELVFTDKDNQPVEVTQKTEDSQAKFFYRTDSLSGVDDINGTGQIAAKSNADIHWMIIPAFGAAQDKDTLYNIGAKLTYELNGQETTVDVVPDYVVVKPQPLLTLDYFLPGEVYGDDPFTAEEETPEPFTLGVRIRNDGKGISYHTVIDSAQPKIVENKKNLLVDFSILGSYINNQPADKSLLLNFGDIAGGASTVGRWNMIASLSGTFTDFKATFTHADTLGGAVTSLLKATNTHSLIHDVKADLPDSDDVTDFLARDGDVVRLYESSGLNSDVSEQSSQALMQAGDKGYQLSFPATKGFVYAKVADPFQGSRQPDDVVRSDGKHLLSDNVWLSKSRNKDMSWSYYVNVFDSDSTGQYSLFKHNATYAQGLIAGTVYNDVNADGLLNHDEKGLSHIKVVLSGQNVAGKRIEQVAYTDESGRFSFDKLAAGDYSIWVDDVADMIDGPAVAGSAGGQALAGKIEHIVLQDNMHAENYLFAKQAAVQPPVAGDADIAVNIETVEWNDKLPADTAQFLLTVSNQGPETARNIHVQPELSSDLEITEQKVLSGNFNSVKQRIDALGANETVTMLFTVRMKNADGKGEFTAHINSDSADPDMSNNVASAAVAPGKTDVAINAEAVEWNNSLDQDTAQLLVTISNNGPLSARNVYLQPELPDNLEITAQQVLAGNYNTQEERIDNLAAGESTTLLLTVKVTGSDKVSQFTARIKSQTEDANLNNNEVSIPVMPGAADIALEVEKVELTPALPADCVQLLLTITNNGPADARNISLQSLSDDVQITKQKVVMGNYNESANRIDKLPIGEETIILLTVKITSASGKADFKARVQGLLADPNKTNNLVTFPVSLEKK